MSVIVRVFNIKMRLELVAVGLGVELRSVQESKLGKTTMYHTLRGHHPDIQLTACITTVFKH